MEPLKKKNIQDDLLKIINTVLENNDKKKLESLSPETKLREDIGLDSLGLAELTVRIEAIYDIDIFEEGIVSTIEEIFDKLGTK